MLIRNIELENFTVFDKIKIDFCKGINVLIGDNGMGKTHMLKLLYAFCETTCSREKKVWVRAYPFFLSRYFKVLDSFADNHVIIKINDDMVYDYRFIQANAKKDEPDGFEFDEGVGFGSEGINSVFIPTNEVLTMSNITRINAKYSRELNIDNTSTDIIWRAQGLKPDTPSPLAKNITPILEKLIDGRVFIKSSDNSFWVRKTCGLEVPFTMEAEGLKKLGLLWQLLMNECINKNTILFWDEPEANLNPKLAPVIVDILIELARNDIQVFVATHDYFFPNFLEARKTPNDDVAYHGLFKSKSSTGVLCESQSEFKLLEKNSIIEQSINLYKEEVQKVMEWA